MFKKIFFIHSLFILILSVVTACGGGGGSSSDGGGSPESTGSTYSKSNFTRDIAIHLSAAYDDTQLSFGSLHNAIDAFCLDTSNQQSFDDIKTAWLLANQQWQYVQGVNFGPVSEESRRFRIGIYPNDADRLDDRILTLVDGDDELTPEALSLRSVDLQGLLPIERLFFRENAVELFTSPERVDRHCQYILAVTENLVEIIRPIAEDWQSGGSYFMIFTASTNVEEALEIWFGSIVEHLEIIRDSKLRQVSVGNLNFIESPLAAVSLGNIEENIAYINDVMNLSASTGLDILLSVNDATDLGISFQARIDSIAQSLQATNESLLGLVGEANGSDAIESLADGVQDVAEYMATRIADSLDVFVGFNGADGD